MRIFLLILLSLSSSFCAQSQSYPLVHKMNDVFYLRNDSDGKSSYLYSGRYQELFDLYVNQRLKIQGQPYEYGILVQDNRVVRSLNEIELNKIKIDMLQRKIAAEEGNLIALRNLQIKDFEEQKNKQEQQERVKKFQNLARNDVVAQALNYSSGYEEDSSGNEFWYPVKNSNGVCIYEKFEKKKFFSENNKQLDLSKGDPKTVKVYKSYIKELSREYLTVQIEGIASFSCSSCDSDRLYRAWNLIYSKCIGRRTAF